MDNLNLLCLQIDKGIGSRFVLCDNLRHRQFCNRIQVVVKESATSEYTPHFYLHIPDNIVKVLAH